MNNALLENAILWCKNEIARRASVAGMKFSTDDILSIRVDEETMVVWLRRFENVLYDDEMDELHNHTYTLRIEYPSTGVRTGRIRMIDGSFALDAEFHRPKLVCTAPFLISIIDNKGNVKMCDI